MRCRRSIYGRSKLLLLVAFAAVSLASCGGGPSTVVVPAPRLQPGPSHETPQAAVAGYLTGYELYNVGMVCTYVAPKQLPLCQYLVDHGRFYLGNWSIGNSVVRGDEAIVAVLSNQWCVASVCLHNSDPNRGLPPDSQHFGRAFDVTPNAVPTVSVEKINGQWYVVLA
jgi:hypothetical protein